MRNNKRNMMNNPRRHSNNNNNNRYRNNNGGGGGGGHRNYSMDGGDGDSEFVNPRQRKMAMTQREKYINMGRDAQSSGDRVLAEYYFQHADHYLRIINLGNQHNPPQQNQQQGNAEGGDEDNGNGNNSHHSSHHSSNDSDHGDEVEALPLSAALPAPKGPGRGYDEPADDDRDAV